MSLAFAAKAIRNQTFCDMAVLSFTSVAKDKIMNNGTPPLELAFAKGLLRNPLSFSEPCVATILQIPAMHATDPSTQLPSEATFLSSAAIAWPYLITL